MLSAKAPSLPISCSRPGPGSRWWIFALTLGTMAGLMIARGWMYCAGFCFLCLLFLWPLEVGLGSYVLFLPFEPIGVAGDQAAGTSVTWVLGMLAGIAVMWTLAVRGRFQRPPGAVLWWSLFVLWATVTAAWAIDPALTFNRLPTIMSLFFLYLLCACTRFEQRELKMLALLSIVGGCAAALYASFFSVGPGTATLRNSLAWGNVQADPNGFAESLLIPQTLALGGFLLLRKPLARAVMLLAFCVMSYAVLLTLSRGALVALAVTSIIYLRHMPRTTSWRLLVPVLLFGMALLINSSAIFPRLTEAVRTGGAGRLDIWKAGLEAGREHGLIGAGLDNFPLAYSDVAGHASQFQGIARASHNIFLNTWVELGVPGLLLFVIAMGHQLRASKVALRSRIDQFSAPILACHAACWSVVAAGFFLDIVWRKTFWLAWTLLMLSLKARRDYGEEA